MLFFDEIEALAFRRASNDRSAASALVSTFLSEMDGVDADNEGVLVLAATNVPWAVDPAFRRQGRFDRVLFVPPPDAVAREAILKLMLSERPGAEALNIAPVVKATSGFSSGRPRPGGGHGLRPRHRTEPRPTNQVTDLTDAAPGGGGGAARGRPRWSDS